MVCKDQLMEILFYSDDRSEGSQRSSSPVPSVTVGETETPNGNLKLAANWLLPGSWLSL